MYRDNTLIPREAVRLLALGILAGAEKRYGELAGEVRHFTSHVAGPSLELVASPLELLKVEGLIEPVAAPYNDGGEVEPDQEVLRITGAGEAELIKLLTANLRPPVNDINKLILALKLRFLHLLPAAEQRLQVEMLVEISERELARLTELRAHHAGEVGHLIAWLDHDIAAIRSRLDWFRNLEDSLDDA